MATVPVPAVLPAAEVLSVEVLPAVDVLVPAEVPLEVDALLPAGAPLEVDVLVPFDVPLEVEVLLLDAAPAPVELLAVEVPEPLELLAEAVLTLDLLSLLLDAAELVFTDLLFTATDALSASI